jgi:hypothetical protein
MKANNNSAVLDYTAIMEISRMDKEKRLRGYGRRVKMQNFAARHGWRFWTKVFSLFAL